MTEIMESDHRIAGGFGLVFFHPLPWAGLIFHPLQPVLAKNFFLSCNPKNQTCYIFYHPLLVLLNLLLLRSKKFPLSKPGPSPCASLCLVTAPHNPHPWN